MLTFIQSGKVIAGELTGHPEGRVSENGKGWQKGFDLIAEHACHACVLI